MQLPSRIMVFPEFLMKFHCTKKFDCTISNNGYLIIEKSHLIDKVSLIYNIFLFKRMPFPHFIDKYNWKSMIDPIFESFRKIYELKLTELPTDIAIEYLKDLWYLKLKTGIIYLISHTLEQSESLSNPDYYKNGVNWLHFLFYKIHIITEQFISNINTIKPNELIIEFYDGIFHESDYMRFLTDFSELPHLELKRRTIEPKWKIVFHNATILIKLIDQEFMFIKGATFVWYLKIKELNKNYWFTNDNNSDKNKDYSFIHLANLDNFKISNYYKVQDINEIKQLQDEFLWHLSESKSKWEFIISMKYLYSADIDKEQASQLLYHEHWEQIIKEIYNAPKFSCSLMYLNGLLDINKYISIQNITLQIYILIYYI